MEAIKTRRSIRKYLPKPIEQEKLDRVLEAGRLAPSAQNAQNWKFILVRDPDKLKLLYEAAYQQPHMGEAPAAIVCCATSDRVMDCGQPVATVNLSIALSYMMLEARELGLGTCWLGHFRAGEAASALGVPDGVTVVALTPLGYPAEDPEPRPRKTLPEVVGYDTF